MMNTSQIVRAFSGGRLFESAREVIRRRLSQEQYVRLAGLYNSWAARLVERENWKPLDAPVRCDQPLVYINQPPRSGGTLTRNLLDAHPQCHGFPHELSWEKNGYRWDGLGGQEVTEVYERLYDRWIDVSIVRGFDKEHPFYFNRCLQKRLFEQLAPEFVGEERSWLDLYMTSFFNAWVDYQGLYGDKRYTIAFCPWNLKAIAPIDRFFSVYPEGYRIHVVRNPLAWWASEKKYGSVEKEIDEYLQRWTRAVEVGLRAYEQYSQRYLLLHFDDLIRHPESSMQALTERLELPYNSTLTRPTINQMPRSSNTSFGEGQKKLNPAVLDRWKNYLRDSEVESIRKKTESLYARAIEVSVNGSLP